MTDNNLIKSTGRLASGYRINRASDDASGLAISEKMRKQIRGLTQASANAQDGISVCQIADGALDESTSIIQRIRELSIQAANGTNSLSDRQAVQEEVDRLITEVDRICATTTFNTINLLDGTLGLSEIPSKYNIYLKSAPIEDPPDDEDEEDKDASKLRSSDPDIDFRINAALIDPSASASKGTAAMEALQNELISSIVPQCVNGIASTLPSIGTAINSGMVSSKIGLKLYADSSNTLALVSYGASGDHVNKINQIDLSLKINVSSLIFSNGSLTSESRKELEATIIHEMMHAFSVDILTNGMFNARDNVLDDPYAEKFPIWFQEGLAQTVSGGMDWTQYDSGLGIKPGKSVGEISSALRSSANNIEWGGSINNGNTMYGTGYLASMYLGYVASGASDMTAANIASGLDKVIKSIMDGYSLSETIKTLSNGKYTSLHDFQARFGDTDSSTFVQSLVNTTGLYTHGGGRGALVGGDLRATDLVPDGKTTSSVYNPDKNSEYVISDAPNRNEHSGGGSTSSSTKDPNPVIPTPGPVDPPGPPQPPRPPKPDPDPQPVDEIPYEDNTIEFVRNPLNLHVGADAAGGNRISLRIDRMSAKNLGINGISVLSKDDCFDAMIRSDYALYRITDTRARIGAVQNRLEHTVKNLDNIVENTTSAESLIRDTDMAKEMVNYSVNQILMESGMAMLSQANSSRKDLLTLLV